MTEKPDRWLRFRRAVVEERERRGWKQEELATRAGIARPALSRIESGATHSPRMDTAQKIARALGWSAGKVDSLLEPEPVEPPTTADRQALAVARRHLPTAPAGVLERYVELAVKYKDLGDAIRELESRYGDGH